MTDRLSCHHWGLVEDTPENHPQADVAFRPNWRPVK
jgi:hypothetical protein